MCRTVMGDEKTDEVFLEERRMVGKEDSRDTKRFRGISSDSIEDREKLKGELLEELKKTMRNEILGQMKEEMKEMVKEVIKDVMKEAVQGEMKAMREEMKRVCDALQKVERKVDSVEEQLRKRTEEVNMVKTEVRVVKREISVWEKRVEKLEDMVIDQQARSRRNNLMFYGIEEKGGKEDCKKLVRELIVDKCGVSGAVRLERVHRVPPGERPAGTRSRPIVCKFLDFNEKMDVKKNARQLPRDIRVADDLPKEIRDAQKLLMPELKKAREEGKDAFVAFPARLIVNKTEVKAMRPGSVAPDGRQGAHGS